MLASTALSAFLCGSGLVTFFISTVAMGYLQRGVEDPLRAADLSPRERARLRGMILRKEIPEDPLDRALAFKWAAYATSTFVKTLRWRPLFNLGFIVIFCGLYWITGLAVAAIAMQIALLLLLTWVFVNDLRRVENSRQLLEWGEFTSIPPKSAKRSAI